MRLRLCVDNHEVADVDGMDMFNGSDTSHYARQCRTFAHELHDTSNF